jgi:RNA polymerase sigma-70 factor (ECF subfamily)
LLAAVDALPDDCRQVVLLYYYNDLTYRDLAHMLGVSPATINARLTRARALLRERLSLQCGHGREAVEKASRTGDRPPSS